MEDPLMRDMLQEEPNKYLEGIIMKVLLLQEAKKQGLSAPVKTYKDAEKNARSPEESIITGFLEKKFSSPPEVTREEIEAFYKMYKDQMEGKPLKEVTPGLPLIICPEAYEHTDHGNELEVSLATGTITNLAKGTVFRAEPIPPFMQDIISRGGLMKYVAAKQHFTKGGQRTELNTVEGTPY